MDEKNKKCENCEYFFPLSGDESVGECRCNFPSVDFETDDLRGVWPRIRAVNWCGYWTDDVSWQ